MKWMLEDPISSALANCNPNIPLEPSDPRFVDFDSVREFAVRVRLNRLLKAAGVGGDRFIHVALAGQRGSGKSTELNRAMAELNEAGYVTVSASVNENLDPNDISFSDIMRLIVLMLNDAFGDLARSNGHVEQAFSAVRSWFADVTRSSETALRNATEFGLRAGLGGKARVEGSASADGVIAGGSVKARTDLGELMAAINVVRRSEGAERTEIKEKIERYNSEVVQNINTLLRAVRIGAPERLGSGLVLILDNVDKYEPETTNRALLRHASLFQQLEAHLVFTIQSAVLHSPVEENVPDRFTTIELPMLPVFQEKSRSPRAEVVKLVRDAVYLRVPSALFADGEAGVDALILASGGCWRDLLRLLESALLDAGSLIGEKQVKRARQEVGQTFQRLIQNQEQLQILAKTRLEHSVLSDKETQFLLYHRCILVYNGNGWYDVHPLLEGFAAYERALKEQRQTTPAAGA